MGKQEDRKSQGRHASRDRQQPARRREPLRDNYYYEEPSRGGDMDEFLRKLREDGFQEAQLLPTADGSIMTPWEGKTLFLSGSALLVGRK